MKTYIGVKAQLNAFLISPLDGSKLSGSSSGRFNPGKIAPGTHYIRGWMCPGASLDAVAKRKFPPPC